MRPDWWLSSDNWLRSSRSDSSAPSSTYACAALPLRCQFYGLHMICSHISDSTTCIPLGNACQPEGARMIGSPSDRPSIGAPSWTNSRPRVSLSAPSRAHHTHRVSASVRRVPGDPGKRPRWLPRYRSTTLFLHPRPRDARRLVALARDLGVRRVVALAAANIDDPSRPDRGCAGPNREASTRPQQRPGVDQPAAEQLPIHTSARGAPRPRR